MPEPRITHPRSPRSVALTLAIVLALAAMPAMATHQSGTISPSNPTVSWSNATLLGSNPNGESDCMEDVTCETYVLTLAAGDYGPNSILVRISWTSPVSDWDLFVHEDTPDGFIVAENTDFIPNTEAQATFDIESTTPAAKTYYIHVVAFAVSAPGYSGEASLTMPTATLLSMFVAEGEAEGIRLRWQFGPGAAFDRVTVERSTSEAGPWSPLEMTITPEGEAFTALDATAEPGLGYSYRIVATDRSGRVSTFGPVAGTRGQPGVATAPFLGMPSPNPTSGTSSVQFRIGKPGFVELAVFDLDGRRVRTLHASDMAAGVHGRSWDGRTDRGSDASAGVYLFVLRTADGTMKSQHVALVR